MRLRQKLGRDDGAIVPFLSLERGDGRSVSVGMTSAEAIALWHQWRWVEVTLLWNVDPVTSASSSTTYSRSLILERSMPGLATEERDLVFPGIATDVAHPYGIGGTVGSPNFTDPRYNAFRYLGFESLGADDVFNATELTIALSLFEDGYTAGGGLATVKTKLRVSMVYDDGTEGTLLVHSVPEGTEFDGLVGGGGVEISGTGSLIGHSFSTKSGNTAGTSTYFTGGAPEVSIAPVLWWPYDDEEGANPVINQFTGVKLRDHRQLPV